MDPHNAEHYHHRPVAQPSNIRSDSGNVHNSPLRKTVFDRSVDTNDGLSGILGTT